MKDKISDLIKVYNNAIPSSLCQNFINYYEKHKELQNINGKGKYDYLVNSRWTEINIIKHLPKGDLQQFSNIMLDYKERYEKECGLPPLPPPQGFADMRLKKYETNNEDCFEIHYDNYGPVSNRYLVFLWTLNTVAEGGETDFVDLDISLKPEEGRLVIFPPYWMYRHQAKIPISEPKYIINTFAVW
jgi:hypothetical protein